MQHEPGHGRRGMAFSLVLLAHAFLLWVSLQARAPWPHAAGLERLTLIYLPAPTRTGAEKVPAAAAPSAHRPSRRPLPAAPGPATGASPAVPWPSTAPLPPIDGTAQQQRAAGSQAQEIWKQLSQHCRDAVALHIYPPECHRYVAPAPWEPEEKRFGLAGPLPYVRLGHCVVGLGFWGCTVGKPPPPNGKLFDGMRDPDRPGALPDNGGYQPPPAARERLH